MTAVPAEVLSPKSSLHITNVNALKNSTKVISIKAKGRKLKTF